ncbi:hypothetical protein GLYMA_04G091550v4 [Glycine max]|nr:hypothetical protein GLYMA_04G091550v4 [Glycine max]KAH1110557.1 hypothetical protein GYH30_009411 [Glycine max]
MGDAFVIIIIFSLLNSNISGPSFGYSNHYPFHFPLLLNAVYHLYFCF